MQVFQWIVFDLVFLGPFGLNLLLLKLKTENWKHCSKITFSCVNSVVGPVNSAWTMREQCFFSLHSKIMWFYCSRVEGKKKKSTKTQNVDAWFSGIQTDTLCFFVSLEERNIKVEQNYIFSSIFSRYGL